jgi:hypothetical protein
MRKYVAVVCLLTLFAALSVVAPTHGQDAKPDKKAEKDNTPALLTDVITEVEKTLDTYRQQDDVVKNKTLPDLLTADFDFKTVVDKKEGIGISFLIFKIGYTRTNETVNDVDFQYTPLPPPPAGHGNFRKPQAETLQKALLDTLNAAGKAIQTQRAKPAVSKNPLVFKQATITISFGVTDDVTIGAAGGVSLTTINASLEGSKNAVHQLKLVFAPPPPKMVEAVKKAIGH